MIGYIEVENPNSCLDCRFCRELDEGKEACCNMMDEPEDDTLCRMIDVHYCMGKPTWCPIKIIKELSN